MSGKENVSSFANRTLQRPNASISTAPKSLLTYQKQDKNKTNIIKNRNTNRINNRINNRDRKINNSNNNNNNNTNVNTSSNYSNITRNRLDNKNNINNNLNSYNNRNNRINRNIRNNNRNDRNNRNSRMRGGNQLLNETHNNTRNVINRNNRIPSRNVRNRNRTSNTTSNTRRVTTMAEAKQRIRDLKLKNKELIEENEILKEDNDQIKDDLDKDLQEMSQLQSEIELLKSNYNNSISNSKSIQLKYSNIESKLSLKLEELNEIRNLKDRLSTQNETQKLKIINLKEELKLIKEELSDITIENNTNTKKINELNSKNKSLNNENLTLNNKLMDLTNKCDNLNNDLNNKVSIINSLENNNNVLNKTIELNTIEIRTSKNEILSLKNINNRLNDECNLQSQDILNKSKKIEELEEEIERLKQQSRKDEEIRKKLHNTIQELKGNIRVYCRVRPYLNNNNNDHETFLYPKNEESEQESIELIAKPTTNYVGDKIDGKKYTFAFDKVFKPFDKQNDVFNDISQLVQSALDGYNVCIFAYGQTGSGKTYTMEGPQNSNSSNRGMIPRSIEQIFKHSEYLLTKGWKFDYKATFLEIYNEKIRDLLVLDNSKNNEYLEIKIKNNNKNKMFVEVPGLTSVSITSSEDALPLLKRAGINRSTSKTECNERSSRSHSVFQLFLTGKNNITSQLTNGVLNLIDLAGSERLKKSNSTGQQLKETQNINRSLSCLGDVISAIHSQKGHIPYRNSKLTYLLMNYFGGKSKTLMFVNLCPESDKFDESLCSLRFAAKVNACQIGIARRSIQSN